MIWADYYSTDLNNGAPDARAHGLAFCGNRTLEKEIPDDGAGSLSK